jgi:hypothetical protein
MGQCGLLLHCSIGPVRLCLAPKLSSIPTDRQRVTTGGSTATRFAEKAWPTWYRPSGSESRMSGFFTLIDPVNPKGYEWAAEWCQPGLQFWSDAGRCGNITSRG